MGVKHTVLPDCQPPTLAFTVLAQLCDPKANEAEMGAALFTKNGEGSLNGLKHRVSLSPVCFFKRDRRKNGQLSRTTLAEFSKLGKLKKDRDNLEFLRLILLF